MGDNLSACARAPSCEAGHLLEGAGSAGALEVRPWPYEMDHFRVAVDVYIVDQVAFADEDELAAALRRAKVTRRVWELFRK